MSTREDAALKSILKGNAPAKRIFVAGSDPEFIKDLKEKREAEQEKIKEKLDITKDCRTPWFCPKCTKTMKAKVDDKMWRLYGHCFDCQVKIETKMRINGTYDKWASDKVKANKLSWISEQIEGIMEWREQSDVVFLNQTAADGVTVDEERYAINTDKVKAQADDAIEHLEQMRSDLIG